jgi:RNA recognition motif-containing protein
MRIYVGNMPYSMTEAELHETFAPYGEVKSVSLVTDKFTGAPKGFAFVEMATPSEGQAAIAALRDKPVGGRTLRVDEARPRDAGGGPGSPRPGSRAPRPRF